MNSVLYQLGERVRRIHGHLTGVIAADVRAGAAVTGSMDAIAGMAAASARAGLRGIHQQHDLDWARSARAGAQQRLGIGGVAIAHQDDLARLAKRNSQAASICGRAPGQPSGAGEGGEQPLGRARRSSRLKICASRSRLLSATELPEGSAPS
jgi:hypothetical protein